MPPTLDDALVWGKYPLPLLRSSEIYTVICVMDAKKSITDEQKGEGPDCLGLAQT